MNVEPQPSMDARSRSENLRRLANEAFDILIIGGGINGAGVARDAAMRGLKVAVVEESDFASGTSSRSSKLVHGGIRYLENFEFQLVFEALSERQKLFRMAPHLVHPLRFLIPLYRGGRVGMGLMGLGMWAYDALSLFQAPELHERYSVQEAIEEVPSLQREGLLGAYSYYDAYMDDDRLVFETLRSACDHGALAVSYISAKEALVEDGRIAGVACQDQGTGREFLVHTSHVVSTVGAWTDRVAPRLVPNWKNWLRPTKGVHLTLSRERLPIRDAVVMAAEKRIVFAIPRHEMVIVGTTDTDYPGDPGGVVTEKSDAEYVLGVLRRYFPGAGIVEDDILSSYAGVRPLVDDQSDSAGKTSREHRIWSDASGITFVAGGKYTTYRLIAEQTVDEVLDFFAPERVVKLKSCSTDAPLNPLVTLESWAQRTRLSEELSARYQLDIGAVARLVERHGDEARDLLGRWTQEVRAVLGFGASDDDLVWGVEVAHAVTATQCASLRDFVLRRSPLFLATVDHGKNLYDVICRMMTHILGGDQFEVAHELTLMARHQKLELGWRT